MLANMVEGLKRASGKIDGPRRPPAPTAAPKGKPNAIVDKHGGSPKIGACFIVYDYAPKNC